MIAIPLDVSFEEATFVEPVNTCLKAVRKARVAAGETVLVIGQGPIGMLLAMLAKHEGARVYTSDPMPGRRAASVRFGAAESFDPAESESARGNKAPHGWPRRGRGAAGRAQSVISSGRPMAIARPGGRVLLFAHNDPVLKLNFPRPQSESKKRKFWAAIALRWTTRRSLRPWSSVGRLPLRELISHRFPLERIADALELAAHPKEDTLKVVITHE